MWELDNKKKSCSQKNWCFWNVVLEKTLESPLDCREIQPDHPKGSQSWLFIGRTDVEAETLIFWPPDGKSWLIGKDPDAGKDWGQEEKGTTEDELVGWHHWLNGHGFGWTPGVGDGQGGLPCCSSWGRKESDTTERLNWIELSSMWDECNYVLVWTFFGTAFLLDWNENWPFPVLWPLLSFPNLLVYCRSTLIASSFKIWNSSARIPSLYNCYFWTKILLCFLFCLVIP